MGDLGFGYKSASKAMSYSTILTYLTHVGEMFVTNDKYLGDVSYWNNTKFPFERSKKAIGGFILNDLNRLDEIESDANINSVLRDKKAIVSKSFDKLRMLNRATLTALRNAQSLNDIKNVRNVYAKSVDVYANVMSFIIKAILEAKKRQASFSGNPIEKLDSNWRDVNAVEDSRRQRSGRLA